MTVQSSSLLDFFLETIMHNTYILGYQNYEIRLLMENKNKKTENKKIKHFG